MPSDASHRAIREIVVYGAVCGVLIGVLQFTKYRLLVLEHSVELYVTLIAAIFAVVGIWLGLKLTRTKTEIVVKEVMVPVEVPAATGPFVVNDAKLLEFGLTVRELEILGLIASGLSNREIADTIFVSENTVKTHSSRLFDKLGARRRTQAVQIGKASGLIP